MRLLLVLWLCLFLSTSCVGATMGPPVLPGGVPNGGTPTRPSQVIPQGGQPPSLGQTAPRGLTADDLYQIYQTILTSAVVQVDPAQLIAGARKGAHAAAADQGLFPVEAAILDTAGSESSSDPDAMWADFGNAYDTFVQKLGNRIDIGPVGEGAARGMLAALGDPISTYLSRAAIGAMQSASDASIGVILAPQTGGPPIVREVEPDGPADRAGIKPGDVIRSVGGKNTAGSDLYDVLTSLSGADGTEVDLTVAGPGGATRDLQIDRARVRPPPVTAQLLDGIEVIQIQSFDSGTTDTVRRALLDSVSSGAIGWLIDLRGNGEGNMTEAVSVASLFTGRQVVAQSEDHGGARAPVQGSGPALSTQLPLAVLIDSATAGPGEMVAAAIHDYSLGTVVGTPTAGRLGTPGLVRLSDGSAAEITTSRVLSPRGTPLLGSGFPPDIVVEDDAASLAAGIDPPSDRAMEVLRAGGADGDDRPNCCGAI